MVLRDKGSVNLFYENLREVSVSFKNRGGVSVILINLRGGDCNLPFIISYSLIFTMSVTLAKKIILK
jgi:hypothetical protein